MRGFQIKQRPSVSVVKYLSLCAMCVFLQACAQKPLTASTKVNEVQQAPSVSSLLTPSNRALFDQATQLITDEAWVEAEKVLSEIEATQPNTAAVSTNLALCVYRQGDTERAWALFKQIEQQHPSYVDGYLVAAQLFQEEGAFKAANNRLLAAQELEPSSRIIAYNLGIINELYLHDYNAAINYYDRYLQLSSSMKDTKDYKLVAQWKKLLERRL